MKNITKIFAMAFALVLLVGVIVGVSVSASEEEVTAPTYSSTSTNFIVSSNVSYAGKLHLCLAIDPTHSNFFDGSASNYVDGNIDLVTCTIKGNTYTLTPSEEKTTLPNGKKVYVVETPGIAPKDILTPISVTVKLSCEASNKYYYQTKTFTLAEYFYQRLYVNGIVNATSEKELAQKELYLATLAYAVAAQEHFNPDATDKISELIYLWGDVGVVTPGFVDKGYLLKLGGEAYSLEYYSLSGVTGSDITNGAGGYTITSSTKVEFAKETVVAPEGALTFDKKAEGNYATNDSDNALIKIYGQKDPIHSAYVNASSSANDSIKTLVYNKTDRLKNGTSNAGSWIILKNNSGVVASEETPLVFEARMRSTIVNGSPFIRVYAADRYTKPSDGTQLTSSNVALSGCRADGWYTMKMVITPGKAVVYIDGVEVKTITLKTTAAAEVVQFQNASSDYTNYEFEYIYFGAEPEKAAVCTPAQGTRVYDAEGFTDDAVKKNVLTGGASYASGSTGSYDKSFGYIKSEDGNKYLSYVDSNSSGGGQGIVRFSNTNDLTDKDTLTVSFKLRINPLANGTLVANGINTGIDLRIRGKNTTNASNNTAQVMLIVEDGKVVLQDYMGQVERGTAVETNISANEWFTVTISYTSNAETATYTVSNGTDSKTVIAGTLSGFGCDVAELADFTVITMTSFVGVWDIDDASIVATKAE